MKIKEYKVISYKYDTGFDVVTSFDNAVNNEIKKGFVPYGGVSVLFVESYHKSGCGSVSNVYRYCQAMVKYEEEPSYYSTPDKAHLKCATSNHVKSEEKSL